MGRRKYTEEFKRETVELSFNSDKSCKVIAEELGINYNLLIRWRKESSQRDRNDIWLHPGTQQ